MSTGTQITLSPLSHFSQPASAVIHNFAPPPTATADLQVVQQAALQTALLAGKPRHAVDLGSIRVEVRPSRSSDPAAPGTWRYQYRGRWHTLYLSGDRPKQEALDAARLAIMCEEAGRRGMIAPHEVPIQAAIEYARGEWKPDAGASPRDWQTFQNYERSLSRIEQHFPGHLLAHFTRKNAARYLELAETIRDQRFADVGEERMISRATAHKDLVHLRMAIRLYSEKARLPWSPDPKLPPAPTARIGFFTRETVARMLMACRGFVIDPQTGTWKTVTVTNPETGLTTTRRFRHDAVTIAQRECVRRLIIIGVYSGTRIDASYGLSWRLHPARGCIDIERGLIHRAGYAEDVAKGKPRLTSAMRMQFLVHARGWRKQDRAHGIKHVLHQPRGENQGKPYRYFPYRYWWDVMSDAGLDQHADPHVLCHTAITWLGIDGYDVFVTADLTGRDPQTVRKFYRQWNLTGQKRAVTIGRLPVAKHVDVEDLMSDDRPRRADRYQPKRLNGKHKPQLPRAPKRRSPTKH